MKSGEGGREGKKSKERRRGNTREEKRRGKGRVENVKRGEEKWGGERNNI